MDRAPDVPADRHYDPAHHLWARRDPDTGRVRIGVDAIGLESLGELAYVALAEPGRRVARGGSLGSLEAAKMTTAITAPCAGTVVARNDAVLADPLLVNREPYGGGWLVEIEPPGPEAWQQDAARLVSGAAVAPWAAAEWAKLREGEAESADG